MGRINSFRSPPKFSRFSLPASSQKTKSRPNHSNVFDQRIKQSSSSKRPLIKSSISKIPSTKKFPLRSHPTHSMSSTTALKRDNSGRAAQQRARAASEPLSSAGFEKTGVLVKVLKPLSPTDLEKTEVLVNISKPLPSIGFEKTEVLINISLKRTHDQSTRVDESHYAKRLKIEVISALNEDVVTQKQLITNYFTLFMSSKQRSEAKTLRRDWHRMPLAAQQGMVNHTGYVCYRLSLLQSLLHLPVFVNWVMDHLDPAKCVSNDTQNCLACCLYDLVTEYWGEARRSGAVTKILNNLDTILAKMGWSADVSFGHADPDEQMIKILEFLREALPTKIFSVFDTMTQFRYTQVIACKCGYKSCRPNFSTHNLSLTMAPKCSTMEGYIAEYMSSKIDYKCPGCKKEVTAKKYFEFTHFPEILSVQLKRIDWNGKKDHSAIPIPTTLNLSKYQSAQVAQHSAGDSFEYRLSAVIKHAGSAQSGHYICSAVGPDGKWMTYDDSHKSKTTVQDATSNVRRFTPVMMYYQKMERRV